MGRILIIAGLILFFLGIAWHFGERLGLGRLPGDITIKRENYSIHIPIITSILISLILSVVFWLISYFRR